MTAERKAERLGELLRQDATSPVSAEARTKFLNATASPPVVRNESRRGPVWALAGAVACAAVLVVWLISPREMPAISYQLVTPASGEPGQLVAKDDPLGVRFSDGSSAELGPRGEARVDETRVNGATLRLVRGKLAAHVVHTGAARWAVQAGPYTVQVVGTRFTTQWNPDSQQLEVSVTEGAVRVESAASGSVLVGAGQQLHADAKERTHAVSSGSVPAPPPPSAPEVEATPSASAKVSAVAAPFGALSKARKAGDFEGVIAAANTAGLERCLASCNSAELLALADAARYTGRAPLAERALLALQGRGGDSAKLSAFLLGRHFEASGSAAALKWYDQYLSEAPSGSYAAEALAGKMSALERQGQRAAASAVARQYLERYPDGTRVTAARRLALRSATP